MHRDRRHVVVGAGAVGSAAAYQLARAVGERVLVLDADLGAHPPTPVPVSPVHPHDRAALGAAAYDAWREVERVSGQTLLAETTAVVVADRRRHEVARHAALADAAGLDFEVLDPGATARRWPPLRLHDGELAFVAPRGGILDAGRGAAAHLALARGHGAEVRPACPVRALRPAGHGVEVVLDDEVVVAEHVVVAVGAATNTVLSGVRALPLTPAPQQLACYAPTDLLTFSAARFPVLTWYGWRPAVEVHRAGAPSATGPPGVAFSALGTHGATTTRLVQHSGRLDPALRAEFLATRLPGFAGPDPEHATRMLPGVVLPDGGVVLDTVPEAPRLTVVVGTGRHEVSAALFGRVLADLALTGRTRVRIDALALDRSALAPTPSG